MSEDLKEYLSTISRPTHIASETELSLYKVSMPDVLNSLVYLYFYERNAIKQ